MRGLFGWLWRDFEKGSIKMGRAEIIDKLMVGATSNNIFSKEQMLRLFGDSEYLVLSRDNARRFVDACAVVPNTLFIPESFDCDDFEAVFRANRAWYRKKCGLSHPEAMGGFDYFSTSLGRVDHGVRRDNYHRAAWVLWHDDGRVNFEVYQPQSDKWQDPRIEVQSATYYDA